MNQTVFWYVAKLVLIYPVLFGLLGASAAILFNLPFQYDKAVVLGCAGFVICFAVMEFLLLCNWRIILMTIKRLSSQERPE